MIQGLSRMIDCLAVRAGLGEVRHCAFLLAGSAFMTVKIDGVEPNIFPDVEDLDAWDAGRNVELFLDIRVDGRQTPVIKLSYQQAF
jgi:hypothetical protein